jgi:hypothetical protein
MTQENSNITDARIAEIRATFGLFASDDFIPIKIGIDLLAALDAARVWHDKAHAFLRERNDFEARAFAIEAERDRMKSALKDFACIDFESFTEHDEALFESFKERVRSFVQES